MSFQINASYSEELHFEDTPSREIYALLLKAIEAIRWSRGVITENTITAYAGISITSFGEMICMEIKGEVVEITSTCLMPQIWSIGKNKRNCRRLGRTINALMMSCTQQHLQQVYMAASAEFVPAADRALTRGNFQNIVVSTSRISGFMSIFNPKPGYFITPILIDLNIFYFLLIGVAGAGFFPYNLSGFEYLGMNATNHTLTQGQWWRLLSYQFMHAGFMHLIGNMFALLMIGVYLEPLLGKIRFLIFYLVCGVMGGLLSLYMHPFSGSVGASGAIFGMYGVFVALLTSSLIERHARKAIFSTLLFFIGFQLLMGLKGNIDNSAHIGGLVTGCILGKISIAAIRAENSWRTLKRLSAVVLIAVLVVALSMKKMPDQADRFRTHITQFSQNTGMALVYLTMIGHSPDDLIIRQIQYQTLGFWKQNAAVLDKLDQLRIGKAGHARVQLMRSYVYTQVLKASFELRWYLHGRQPRSYEDSIEHYEIKVNQLTRQLANTPWRLGSQ